MQVKMADKLKHEGPEIFRLLVDSIKDYAIYLLDEKGFVKSWNVGGERIKGFSAAEIIGKHYSVFFTPEDVKAGRPERELELARAEGRYEEEAWRVRKDGSRFWASIVLTSLVDDQNRHVGFAKLTRDLTERKKAEETIREQNAELKATDEQLRRALEEREDFISVASHELKTPLTALSMQIESFDKTLRGALKTVESSGGQARRLSELLNELLDLTRIRIGRLTLDRHEMDLGSAVAEIAERLTRGTKAAGQVSVRVGERSVRGTWDSMRIGQVVTNLISNAVKYGDGKPIEVDISMDASNQQAELRVIDHGIGIPKETQGKVFERFERAAGVRKVTGLGLGLYITRQIVEAHGGTITVESEVGRGSTFTVRLPLQAASAAA